MQQSLFYIDHPFDSPADNIALDEVLLLEAQQGYLPEVLRVWESQNYFVVLGLSNAAEAEVHKTACLEDHIPIVRRCSGGGAILQGLGCLNYALVLNQSRHPSLSQIQSTNCWVMTEMHAALSPLFPTLQIQGYTDLTLGNIKISGNAQRRSKDYILFHGTFLYNFELSLIEKYLKMPSKEPDYRKNRRHLEFIQNAATHPQEFKNTLRQRWKADTILEKLPLTSLDALVKEKYSQASWNLRV